MGRNLTSMFKKGTENRWSDEVHTGMVKEASGKTVTLTNGTTHRRNKIFKLMVPQNTVIAPNIEKNLPVECH